jgi:hypothetical protein
MQKFFISGLSVLIILVLNNCKKETESITNPVEDDTTDSRWVVYKPNIYIYPQYETNLNVYLKFPNGGKIIQSIPEYNTGWNVFVKQSGLIDNQYEYLFYEAQIPELLQKDFGWIVNGTQLDSFFTNNLQSLAFSTKEIKDFTDYWIPLLNETKSYSIYPQFNEELSDIIQLDISIRPDNLIRVWYVIEEYTEILDLEEPVIPVFQRLGFVILEWGVVI